MTTATGTDPTTNPDYFALPVEDMLNASAALTLKLDELGEMDLAFGLTFDFPTCFTIDQLMALYPAPALPQVADLELALWGPPPVPSTPAPVLQLVENDVEEVQPA